uniref:RRM domain-containing protein n=2 Tax=Panagrolaimus sp. JU765 TaxID=591449 RepID=A0AC34QG44_9BILA
MGYSSRDSRDYRDDYRDRRDDYRDRRDDERDRRDYRDDYRERRDRYDDRRSSYRRRDDGRENPRPSTTLGIFGMSLNTTENDLRDIFERYGHVESIKIIQDHGTGKSRGFGFIAFDKQSAATKARDRVADMVIDGMKVRVDYAVERRRSPPIKNRSPIRRVSRSPVRRSKYSRSPRTPPRIRDRSPVQHRGSRTPPSRDRSPVRRYSRSPSR